MVKTVNKQSKSERKYSFAFKITLILLIFAVILLIKHLVMQYLNLVVFNEHHGFVFELSNRLDFDDEISVPTWFSVILLFIISVVSLFAAYLDTNKNRKIIWSILGVFALLLSIDEAASIHEFILQNIHNVLYLDQQALTRRNAWWIIAPFILVGLVLLLWGVIKTLPKRTSLLFALGATVMVVGALLIDAVAVGVTATSFAYQGLVVALEEFLEIIGSLIILYAILDYLESNFSYKIQSAIKQLK